VNGRMRDPELIWNETRQVAPSLLLRLAAQDTRGLAPPGVGPPHEQVVGIEARDGHEASRRH
jgi:hypothetical protein